MYSKVLVGVDGSPASRAALRWGADEARRHGVPLAAVIAWHYPIPAYVPMTTGGVAPFDEMQAAAVLSLRNVVLDELGEDATTAEVIAECGSSADAIEAHADAATLVVVGHDPSRSLAEILGHSTGQQLRRGRRQAVAVIRSGRDSRSAS